MLRGEVLIRCKKGNTDQMHKKCLQNLASSRFNGPLDLVIDDASHLYEPTKASFEALFPFLRQGGLYIIEDWAWGHWKEFQDPNHPWSKEPPLTKLVLEILESVGTSQDLISALTVYEGFVVVEKGPGELKTKDSFKLEDHILRLPKTPTLISALKRVLVRKIDQV